MKLIRDRLLMTLWFYGGDFVMAEHYALFIKQGEVGRVHVPVTSFIDDP